MPTKTGRSDDAHGGFILSDTHYRDEGRASLYHACAADFLKALLGFMLQFKFVVIKQTCEMRRGDIVFAVRKNERNRMESATYAAPSPGAKARFAPNCRSLANVERALVPPSFARRTKNACAARHPFFTNEAVGGQRCKCALIGHDLAKNRTKNGRKGNFLKCNFAFTQT